MKLLREKICKIATASANCAQRHAVVAIEHALKLQESWSILQSLPGSLSAAARKSLGTRLFRSRTKDVCIHNGASCRAIFVINHERHVTSYNIILGVCEVIFSSYHIFYPSFLISQSHHRLLRDGQDQAGSIPGEETQYVRVKYLKPRYLSKYMPRTRTDFSKE